MWNIFEQPWLLIIVAVILFIAHRIWRGIQPEKMKNKYLLVPLVVLLLAIGLDFIFKTDVEKINGVIKTTKRAAVEIDTEAVKSIVWEGYSDIANSSRDEAISYFKSGLSVAPLERVFIAEKNIEINGEKAKVRAKAGLIFKPEAPISATSIVLEVELKKFADGRWLIVTSELIEFGKQKMNWNQLY